MDDSGLTVEQIEWYRGNLWDSDEWNPAGVAEINQIFDLALSALRQDSSGGVDGEALRIAKGVVSEYVGYPNDASAAIRLAREVVRLDAARQEERKEGK